MNCEEPAPVCGYWPIEHILSGCKTSWTQGRYTERHNQVLKSLVCLFKRGRKVDNRHIQSILANGQS